MSRVRFTESELREAMGLSRSWSEVLRRLGYRSAGGNWRTLQKYARLWAISSDHFDPGAARAEALARANVPKSLTEIMVEGSTYSRAHLKRRLFDEGVKDRCCELCGLSEVWRGRRMALILDHINGVPDDHRLENLRIVCPNCAATLDTHCGSKNRRDREARECKLCGKPFEPRHRKQQYCSSYCGSRRVGPDGRHAAMGVPRPSARQVKRPSYEQLRREISEGGYLAVGRKYGVSDNAIRKWVRFYENEMARESGP